MFIFHSHKIPFIDKRIKNTLIWVKNNWTAGDLKGDFGNQYECIAFIPKGDFELKTYRYSNVLEFDRVPPTSLQHPTEKPLLLLKRLIECATNVGDIVFDPFMGSGSTCVAAKQMGRNYIGIDIDPIHFSTAEKRLEKVNNHKITDFFGMEAKV